MASQSDISVLDADEKVDQKQVAIVAAARKTFLAKGYDAASMDEIAQVANVSKRTVYNRFRSKEDLFAAAIADMCQRLLPENIDDLEASLEPIEFMYAISRRFLEGVLEPDAIALRRIAAFEATRNPSVGETYMENGPNWIVTHATPLIERLIEKGVLKADDPLLAVWQLGALIAEPLLTAAIMGQAPDDLADAIDKQVRSGIDAFLKIYGAK